VKKGKPFTTASTDSSGVVPGKASASKSAWVGSGVASYRGALVLTFDTVSELGLALPDVVDGTAYGAPALKLRGKFLACIPTNKSAEANSIVVRIDLEQRAELLREHPDVYYITDHYAPHASVLVRLSKIARGDLRELLRDAHRFILSSDHKPRTTKTGLNRSARRSSGLKRPRNR